MNDRSIIIIGGIVGALTGAVVGYAFFTPTGQRWRIEAGRNFSAFAQEAERLLSAADQVRQSVAELRGGKSGWPRTA